MLELRIIHPEFIIQSWGVLEPLVTKVAPYCEDYTVEQAKLMMATGRWKTYVVVNPEQEATPVGFFTVSYDTQPNDCIAHVVLSAGKGYYTKEVAKLLQKELKYQGATKVQCNARPSVARLLQRVGFEPVTTIMRMVDDHE